jgi:hypothetical protein
MIHTIQPTAVYSVESARASLGLAKATIGREVRLGRLRVAKRAGKYFLLGEWLLAWIRDGEIHPCRGIEASSGVLEN